MNIRHRRLLGRVFLALTICLTVTALAHGGFWWAGVTISAAITLWGIGPSDSRPT